MSKSPDAFRTISEVADWLGVQAHVLRFWESKFTQVKPVKRAGGRRYYRPADMQLLGGIRKLLHDDGLSIKDVQALLRDRGVAHVAALSPALDGDDSANTDPDPLPPADNLGSNWQETMELPQQPQADPDPEASGNVLGFPQSAASAEPEPETSVGTDAPAPTVAEPAEDLPQMAMDLPAPAQATPQAGAEVHPVAEQDPATTAAAPVGDAGSDAETEPHVDPTGLPEDESLLPLTPDMSATEGETTEPVTDPAQIAAAAELAELPDTQPVETEPPTADQPVFVPSEPSASNLEPVSELSEADMPAPEPSSPDLSVSEPHSAEISDADAPIPQPQNPEPEDALLAAAGLAPDEPLEFGTAEPELTPEPAVPQSEPPLAAEASVQATPDAQAAASDPETDRDDSAPPPFPPQDLDETTRRVQPVDFAAAFEAEPEPAELPTLEPPTPPGESVPASDLADTPQAPTVDPSPEPRSVRTQDAMSQAAPQPRLPAAASAEGAMLGETAVAAPEPGVLAHLAQLEHLPPQLTADIAACARALRLWVDSR